MNHLGHAVVNSSSKGGKIEERNKQKSYLRQLILIIQLNPPALSAWVPATMLGQGVWNFAGHIIMIPTSCGPSELTKSYQFKTHPMILIKIP